MIPFNYLKKNQIHFGSECPVFYFLESGLNLRILNNFWEAVLLVKYDIEPSGQ